jgi:molecular chaperone GrpE
MSMADETEITRQEPVQGDAATSGAQESPQDQAPARGGEPAHPPIQPAVSPEALADAERRAREHQDAWLRAKAETDNVRKRAQIDVANAHKYALETFSSELLPVKDSLEAALATDKGTTEALRSGVELTLKQLVNVFEKSGLKEINPVGEKFDPHRHQAISMLPSDKEPNTVINVLQKGYLLNDRVIRPALVTVAKGRDA